MSGERIWRNKAVWPRGDAKNDFCNCSHCPATCERSCISDELCACRTEGCRCEW